MSTSERVAASTPGARLMQQPVSYLRLGYIRLGRGRDGAHAGRPAPAARFLCPGAVSRVYGPEPPELHILLPSEDESEWLRWSYRCFTSHGEPVCRGDGFSAVALVDPRTGSLATGDVAGAERRRVRCNPWTCRHYGRSCRRVMSLQFLLPRVPGLGVWQIDTASRRSMLNVTGGVQLLHQLCGRVSMVPLLLKLVPGAGSTAANRPAGYVLVLDMPCRPADLELRSVVVPVFPDESGPAQAGTWKPSLSQ